MPDNVKLSDLTTEQIEALECGIISIDDEEGVAAWLNSELKRKQMVDELVLKGSSIAAEKMIRIAQTKSRTMIPELHVGDQVRILCAALDGTVDKTFSVSNRMLILLTLKKKKKLDGLWSDDIATILEFTANNKIKLQFKGEEVFYPSKYLQLHKPNSNPPPRQRITVTETAPTIQEASQSEEVDSSDHYSTDEELDQLMEGTEETCETMEYAQTAIEDTE